MPFPKPPVVLDPRRRIPHGLGQKTTVSHSAILLADEQASPLEHPQVLGDGGKGDSKGLGQFAHRGLATGQARKDGSADGIGERAEGGIERGRPIVNHMV
ncbi:MAG TPA: hypothetical protein VKE24_09880 [Candidatus Acidoferrales bacterium]|nr:hypothetical protein [Candidatus Acidoferrales bacterium]